MSTTNYPRNSHNNEQRISNLTRKLQKLKTTFGSDCQVLQQQITHLKDKILLFEFIQGDVVDITINYKEQRGPVGNIIKFTAK